MSIKVLWAATAAAALLSSWVSPAWGQEARIVTLVQAQNAARDNLSVSQALRLLSAAQADVRAADRAPLPTLSGKFSQIDLQHGIGDGNVLTQKRIDKSIGIDWTWERGNKRALRAAVAQSAAQAAQADVADVRLQQVLAVTSAYYDLLAAQERLEQVKAIEQSAVHLAKTANQRVNVGDLAVQDAQRIEIEAERAHADTQAALLDKQRASVNLAQWMGLASPEPLQADAVWPTADTLPTAVYARFEAWVDARPDIQAAAQRVQAAQAFRDGAQALKRSDVTLGSSLDHYPGTSTRQLELRLSMPLQWDANYFEGEIARAEAQLLLAQDMHAKARRDAFAELQRQQQELTTAHARILSYRSSILPRARQVAERAETAYNKGALALSDLLDARRTLRATLLDYIAAQNDFAHAWQAWQLRTMPAL